MVRKEEGDITFGHLLVKLWGDERPIANQCFVNSSLMALAALRPSLIASKTVRGPLTISPPANIMC